MYLPKKPRYDALSHDIHFFPLSTGEGQQVNTITFSKLRQNVAVLASALRNLGIKKGDRVVGKQTIMCHATHPGYLWRHILHLVQQQYSGTSIKLTPLGRGCLLNRVLLEKHLRTVQLAVGLMKDVHFVEAPCAVLVYQT